MRGRPKEGEEEPGDGGWDFTKVSRDFPSGRRESGWQHPGSQESQTSRPLGLRALRLRGRILTVKLSLERAKEERKVDSISKAQCTSFLCSWYSHFPVSQAGDETSRTSGQGISSCPASLHTDPFLLPCREWEAAVSGALLFGLSTPSYQREALCGSLSPIPGWGNNTERNNPSIWAPSFHSCVFRQFGGGSPDPKARIWLKQEGAAWGGVFICSPRLICFFASAVVSGIVRAVIAKLLRSHLFWLRDML